MQERLKRFFSFSYFNQKKKPKLIIPNTKKSKIKQLKLLLPKYKKNQIIQKIILNAKKTQSNNVNMVCNNEISKKNDLSNNNSKNIISEIYLYEKEKKLISPFSVENIISYIDNLEKKPLGFHIFKSENLNVYICEFSDITEKYYFGVTKYKILKKELYSKRKNNYNVTLDDFSDVYSEPERRKEWDKNINTFELLYNFEISNDDNKKGLDKAFIQHQIYNSPIFGVSQREMVDKKFSIHYNNQLYVYQSSIEEKKGYEIVPKKDDIVRAFTLINCAKYSQDDDYLYLNAFYQTDMRIPIPDTFIQMTVPFTINNYYKKSFEFFQKFIDQQI